MHLKKGETGQLAYVCGLLNCDLKLNSTLNTISWSSHKGEKPVKSIGAAELITAAEAIDEGKLLKKRLNSY